MNIYKILNEMTLYIDENIEGIIDYETLAKMMGTNRYTMQRVFSVIAGIPLAEYIRKRKLSLAAHDFMTDDMKVLDVAIKYGYESSTSFSRAFELFHGIKPSDLKNNKKIKEFPRIIFDERIATKKEIEYSIIELPTLKLYGLSVTTDENSIGNDAPDFFKKIENRYYSKYGKVKYAMTTYDDTFRYKCNKYYCMYDIEIPGFEEIAIEKSRYLRFTIQSQSAKEIQELTAEFYRDFFPSCKYDLKPDMELEYYYEDKTDLLIPIY